MTLIFIAEDFVIGIDEDSMDDNRKNIWKRMHTLAYCSMDQQKEKGLRILWEELCDEGAVTIDEDDSAPVVRGLLTYF